MPSSASVAADPKFPLWGKVVLYVHLLCITVWALPNPPQPVKDHPAGTNYLLVWNDRYLRKFPPIENYLFATGSWQYWDMFAPNPASVDWYGTADVVYADGSIRHYQYPRMFLLSIPEKYLKERYRKFYERAHDDQSSILFPAFGQRIALLNFDNPANPPISVRLWRHWREVATAGKPQAKDYNSYCYYEYAVDLAQLRRAKGLRP